MSDYLEQLAELEKKMSKAGIRVTGRPAKPRISYSTVDFGLGMWLSGERPFFAPFTTEENTMEQAKQEIDDYLEEHGVTGRSPTTAVRIMTNKDGALNYNSDNWTQPTWTDIIVPFSATETVYQEVEDEATGETYFEATDEKRCYFNSDDPDFPSNLNPDQAVYQSVGKHVLKNGLLGKPAFYKFGRHFWNDYYKDPTKPTLKSVAYVIETYPDLEAAAAACGSDYNGNKPVDVTPVQEIPKPADFNENIVGWNEVVAMVTEAIQTELSNYDAPSTPEEASQIRLKVIDEVKQQEIWGGLNVPDSVFLDVYKRLPAFS